MTPDSPTKADVFLHDPANAAFAKEFLGAHLAADLPQQVRGGYIEGALTVLSADFPRKDLERWINIDFRGGVITKEMPVGDVFADGTPESPQAVKDLAR